MVAASAERMEIKKHEEAAYFGEVPMVTMAAADRYYNPGYPLVMSK